LTHYPSSPPKYQYWWPLGTYLLLLPSVKVLLPRARWSKESITLSSRRGVYALRERLEEIEEDTDEAFQARQQLVKLLVKAISADKCPEDGRTEIRITYRFGPPPTSKDYPEDSSVASFKNGSIS
jgi:hypothetical protein